MGKHTKKVKLMRSGLDADIIVLPKSEIVYLCGYIFAENETSFKSQIICFFTDNYLTEIIPNLVGKSKKFRTLVFNELYKAIVKLNPEVGSSWSPVSFNSTPSNSVVPVVVMPEAKTQCENSVQLEPLSIEKISGIKENLSKVVIGQDEALDKIQEYFLCSMAGLGDENRPRGAFMFVGDTGVGKTMVVRELAKYFWGDLYEKGLFVINGSEFMEEHETAKLLGSPQGYVGYEDGSSFLKHVQSNPETILLVDEFEKAHPRLQDVFLQIMDVGLCYDNKGNKIDFTKTFIIFTSNIGTNEVYHKESLGFVGSENNKQVDVYVGSALHKFCRIEFLKRFDGTVIFNSLSRDDYIEICKLEVGKVIERLKGKNVSLRVYDKVYGALVSEMGKKDTSRDLKTIIRNRIVIPCAKILTSTDYSDEHRSLYVGLKDGDVYVKESGGK